MPVTPWMVRPVMGTPVVGVPVGLPFSQSCSMTMPYLAMFCSVMSLYVTPETEPVAPETVLMRTPLSELTIVEPDTITFLTVLSDRPPTEPIEMPWPPEHVPPVKWMSVPEFTARQSSWFLTLALVMKTPVEEPTSKVSVLCPPCVSPALLSIVILSSVRLLALLMEKAWTGVFLMLRPVMEDPVREWAAKNYSNESVTLGFQKLVLCLENGLPWAWSCRRCCPFRPTTQRRCRQ